MKRLHSGTVWFRLGANAFDEELVGDSVLIFSRSTLWNAAQARCTSNNEDRKRNAVLICGGPTLWNAVQARCKSINEELKNELCVDIWWPHTMKRFHSGTVWFRLGAKTFDEELVGDSVLIFGGPTLWNAAQARCKSNNED